MARNALTYFALVFVMRVSDRVYDNIIMAGYAGVVVIFGFESVPSA